MINFIVVYFVMVFFYNDEKLQFKIVIINDVGYFIFCVLLDFVFIYVWVLVNEELLIIQEIKIIELYGVSLISDVDDIIKKFNIFGGV